jgi:glycosyltransferase involved in cell wall biosynthesis
MNPRRAIRVAILADLPVDALRGSAQGRGAGHAATWLSQLADAFTHEEDLEIHWIVLRNDVEDDRTEEIGGQFIHVLRRRSMTIDMLSGHRFARSKMLRRLKDISPDLIHVWGSEGSYPSVFGGLNVPSIMSMQGILSEYDRIGSFKHNWRMRLQAWYEKKWVKRARVITTESQWGMEKVRCIAPHADCRIVEYGVNPSFYRVPWRPDPATPCFMYSGGLEWRKGFDLLLEALTIAPTPFWKLWIAGSGPMLGDLMRLQLPHAVFLGNMKWSEMQDRMSRSWGLVLPTRADTSPNAVKEARVIGLPVITSVHGGQSSYIQNGKSGIIVEPLTAYGIRNAMDLLASDFQQVTEMGASGHDEDREYFQPGRTSRGFASLYRELASEQQSGNFTVS